MSGQAGSPTPSNLFDSLRQTLPSILHLPGVHLRDYHSIEDAADQRFAGSPEPEPDAQPIFSDTAEGLNVIPTVFTCVEDWPRCTDLACWHCGQMFDNRPVFVPTYAQEGVDAELSMRVEIGVRGNMCSFPCAAAWIDLYLRGSSGWHPAKEMLCLVYFMFTGHHTTRICSAPPPEKQRRFGGPLSAEEYRKAVDALDPLRLEQAATAHNHAQAAPCVAAERVEEVLAMLAGRAGRRRRSEQCRPPARGGDAGARESLSVWDLTVRMMRSELATSQAAQAEPPQSQAAQAEPPQATQAEPAQATQSQPAQPQAAQSQSQPAPPKASTARVTFAPVPQDEAALAEEALAEAALAEALGIAGQVGDATDTSLEDLLEMLS